MAKKEEGDWWELMRIIGWGWYVGQRAAELIVYITSIYRRTYRGREKEGGRPKFLRLKIIFLLHTTSSKG